MAHSVLVMWWGVKETMGGGQGNRISRSLC
jgi:hypothetical protein